MAGRACQILYCSRANLIRMDGQRSTALVPRSRRRFGKPDGPSSSWLEEIKTTVFGFDKEKALRTALKRLIANVKSHHCNGIEIDASD